jgi:hypothetical protein
MLPPDDPLVAELSSLYGTTTRATDKADCKAKWEEFGLGKDRSDDNFKGGCVFPCRRRPPAPKLTPFPPPSVLYHLDKEYCRADDSEYPGSIENDAEDGTCWETLRVPESHRSKSAEGKELVITKGLFREQCMTARSLSFGGTAWWILTVFLTVLILVLDTVLRSFLECGCLQNNGACVRKCGEALG